MNLLHTLVVVNAVSVFKYCKPYYQKTDVPGAVTKSFIIVWMQVLATSQFKILACILIVQYGVKRGKHFWKISKSCLKCGQPQRVLVNRCCLISVKSIKSISTIDG